MGGKKEKSPLLVRFVHIGAAGGSYKDKAAKRSSSDASCARRPGEFVNKWLQESRTGRRAAKQAAFLHVLSLMKIISPWV